MLRRLFAGNGPGLGERIRSGPGGGAEIGLWIKRGVFMAGGAMVLYFLHPQIMDVVASAPQLRTLRPEWFIIMVLAETMSFVCSWWLIRIVLPKVSWFVAATSQTCANAISRVVPGGAAIGGATLYRMLSVSGVTAAEAGGALAATSIISTAALFAIPAVALLLALLGAPVPESLWPAAVAGGAMFVVLVIGGWAALVFDRPLVLLGQGMDRVRRAVTGRFGPAVGVDPRHLLAERDRLRSVVDSSWGRCLVAAAGNWVFDYLVLICALYAVGANPRLSIVLLAFAGSSVLTMVPLTPAGFGFVEAGLVWLLVVSGIAAHDAALATAAFRLVTLVFPVLAGAPAYLLYRSRYRLVGTE